MHPRSALRRRRFLGAAGAVALWAGGGASAWAQPAGWPDRPIKFIVAGPAGGGNDIFTRLIAEALQPILRTTIVVENKPGANGILGNDAVAKAPKDGYTFLSTASSSIALNPIVQPKMPYDTERDLLPVVQMGTGGILLVTHPGTGWKSLADVVKAAKAAPGKQLYGSWGVGSTGHLVMEGIKAQHGLDMPHAAYKSTAAETQDLLGGNLPLAFTDIASPLPHIKSGKLVALGVTGSSRAHALPDLPTLGEQGFSFDAEGWFGMFAPGGTPMAIVQKMNAAINQVLAQPAVKQRFLDLNLQVQAPRTAEQFAAIVKGDIERWQGLAKAVKRKID